ncbi:MAG: HD domain-containing protein [Sphingomonadaceae bacterium]
MLGRFFIGSWRDAAVTLARKRATDESLDLWGQGPGESPRFNYRWEHLQAVVRLCHLLGRQLGADMEVLIAAAWLHDIVKSHSKEQGEVSDAELAAEEARRFLLTTDYPPSKTDAVAHAIRVHEGLYKDHPIEPLEAAILWDADKLSKLGATYLVHSLCIRPAFDPIFQGKPTDTDLVVRSMEGWLEIGERIVASMNTQPGREEAARRLAHLQEFVKELKDEWETN